MRQGNRMTEQPKEEINLDADRQPRTLRAIALYFMVGSVMGGLLSIPLSYSHYFTFSSWSVPQLTIAIMISLVFGTLAGIYSDRFISVLAKLLESISSL
jgi:uncharacterized protein involved in cysteine biosynthesis